MSWLRSLLLILFPYRQHMTEEIDYLRAQVAQKQRRIDEMQDTLLFYKVPQPKVVEPGGPKIQFKPQAAWKTALNGPKIAAPEEKEEPDAVSK